MTGPFESVAWLATGLRDRGRDTPANPLPSRTRGRAGSAHGGGHARPASPPHAATPGARRPLHREAGARRRGARRPDPVPSTQNSEGRWSAAFRPRRAPMVRAVMAENRCAHGHRTAFRTGRTALVGSGHLALGDDPGRPTGSAQQRETSTHPKKLESRKPEPACLTSVAAGCVCACGRSQSSSDSLVKKRV